MGVSHILTAFSVHIEHEGCEMSLYFSVELFL